MADKIAPVAITMPAPNIPDASRTGAAIDQALSQPPPATAAPADADAIAVNATLEGSSAADALATEGVLETL